MATTWKQGPVRLIHAALDETPLRGGSVIVRGVVDPDTLPHLHVDDYQREQAPVAPRSSIWQALVNGDILPDIELGIRSEKFTSKDDNFTINDPVFIIDGLQRVSTAIKFLGRNMGPYVRIGATLHFNTTREWERERFKILNSSRSKVSPNVLLRNERENSIAVDLIHSLSANDKDFVLQDRISWSQRMSRQEIMTALNLVKVVINLHNHKAGASRTSLYKIIPVLDNQVGIIGTQTLRQNIKEFFRVVDVCWGVRMVQYGEAIHLRNTFLKTLARVFSDHHDFWVQSDEKKFTISPDLVRKLSSFQPTDPTVATLAGGSGKAHYVLYSMIRDHLNSGKRTKHLKSRNPGGSIDLGVEGETEE